MSDTAEHRPGADPTTKLAVTVNVKDAIFTWLIESEELLTVVSGLFTELAEDKENWFWRHQDEIIDARRALRNIVNDRGWEFEHDEKTNTSAD